MKMTSVDHPRACISPRNARESGVLPITPSALQFTTPGRRERLHFCGARIAAVLLSVVLFTTPTRARAADCPPGDDACELAEAVIRLDADVALRDAKITRLDRELRACRSTVTACPEPQPYPWGTVALAGAGGVLVGMLVVLLARDRD